MSVNKLAGICFTAGAEFKLYTYHFGSFLGKNHLVFPLYR